MQIDGKPLPLSDDRYAYWQTAIKKAREKRKDIADKHDWDGNLKRYEPNDPSHRNDINIGVDFADVEQKKAALLFDNPNVALTDPLPGLEQAVQYHAELLNTLLGPEHADVQPTALKAIFNCLCPSGIGPVILGYHCTKVEIDAPVTDPMTGMPAIDETGELVTQKVPVPIAEKWFVSPLSPKALLLPAELKDTAYQKAAAWLGYDWERPRSQVIRQFKLPKDWSGGAGEGEKIYFDRGESGPDEAANDPLVAGCTIWYRAELDAKPGQVVHPELVRVLTLADGVKDPLEHRDSPDQTLQPDGRLSSDSLTGFNVRPLVLRDSTDAAYVASDVAQSAALTKEQNKYRQMALNKRDTNISMIAVPPKVHEAVTEAKKTAGSGATVYVPVPEESLAGGQQPGVPLVQAVQQRETYQDQELIRQDRARVWALDRNQTGLSNPTKRTATEAHIVQKNSDARFEQERQRVLKWYLYDIVRPFDALVLRYCDQRMAEQILGPQKAQIWLQAKPMLAGGYRYTLQIDSGKYIDVEADRRQALNIINFAAKSPFINQQALWADFCEKFGKDPTKWLTQPEPPKPEPPKVNFSVSAQDLNPAAPQYANVVAVLQAIGLPVQFQPPMPVDPVQAIGQAMVGVGMPKRPMQDGPADKAERLDQHQLDLSGKLPGMAPA